MLTGPAGAGELLQKGQIPTRRGGHGRRHRGLAQHAEFSARRSLRRPGWFALLAPPPGTVLDQSLARTPATLTPARPGPLNLSADIVFGGRTSTVTVTLQVLPTPLADGASIAADGTPDVTEAVDVVAGERQAPAEYSRWSPRP